MLSPESHRLTNATILTKYMVVSLDLGNFPLLSDKQKQISHFPEPLFAIALNKASKSGINIGMENQVHDVLTYLLPNRNVKHFVLAAHVLKVHRNWCFYDVSGNLQKTGRFTPLSFLFPSSRERILHKASG